MVNAKEASEIKDRAAIVFAERLRETRSKMGMTRKELGFATGIHSYRLEGYENRPANLPRALNLILLADVLGVTTDWLLGRDGGA